MANSLLLATGTNQFTQQDALDHVDWTNASGGFTVSADADTAPDGTTTADRLVEGTGAVWQAVNQTATLTADVPHTLSVYCKAGTRDYGSLVLAEAAAEANRVEATFDLTDGSVSASGANGTGILTAAGVIALADDWYFCWLAGNVGNGAISLRARVGVNDDGTLGAYTGDGASYISAWRAKLYDNPTILTFSAGDFIVGRIPDVNRQRRLVSTNGTVRIIEVSDEDDRFLDIEVQRLPTSDIGSFSGRNSLRSLLLTEVNWAEKPVIIKDADGDSFLGRYWDDAFDLAEGPKDQWSGELRVRLEPVIP